MKLPSSASVAYITEPEPEVLLVMMPLDNLATLELERYSNLITEPST
jgi:hypothetical protein